MGPRDRPGRLEVVGVVAACLLVLALLVRLDDAAHRAEVDKSAAARQARVQAQTSSPPRTEGIGSRALVISPATRSWTPGLALPRPGDELLLVIALAGVGLAMTGAGVRLRAVSRPSA